MLEFARSNSRQEAFWQFRIEEKKTESMLESSAFFLGEAEAQAAKIDCRVIGVRDVYLTYTRGRVFLVVGRAELTPC